MNGAGNRRLAIAGVSRDLCGTAPRVHGRTVLLHAEQGLGDTIQFIRYVPLVRELGGEIVVECQAALLPLLRAMPGIGQLIARGVGLPALDVHAPLLGLPGILRTTMGDIPASVPYLSADGDLVEQWRKDLAKECSPHAPREAGRHAERDDYTVGIAWQGNPGFPRDRLRSIPLAFFGRLAKVRGVRLVSLQKGPGADELLALGGDMFILDLGDRLDEEAGSFMDTAAVMKNLDLVICSDSAVAHLAGALAVPVWVALPFVPDWRWLLEREDSPWYPTMRLFRQRRPGAGARSSSASQSTCQLPEKSSTRSDNCQPATAKRSAPMKPVLVEIAPGELMDKITILEIKRARITQADKLRNVQVELATLEEARAASLPTSESLQRLTDQLRQVNEALWVIEDDIRLCEKAGEFGPRFVELARSVYHQNDKRAALKRQINDLLGSKIIEEKSYEKY